MSTWKQDIVDWEAAITTIFEASLLTWMVAWTCDLRTRHVTLCAAMIVSSVMALQMHSEYQDRLMTHARQH